MSSNIYEGICCFPMYSIIHELLLSFRAVSLHQTKEQDESANYQLSRGLMVDVD